MADDYTLTEQERQRQRLHKLADTVQQHEGKLGEMRVVLEMLNRQIEQMDGTMVNRDLLNATVGTAVAKIEMLHNENLLKFDHVDTKLDHLHKELEPIKRGIYWVVALIIGAVLVALLALVIQGVTP